MKKKPAVFILAAFLSLFGLVTEPLGQTSPAAGARPPRTWAVIVGISKYAKLPGGQQLQFADRDAALFADVLKRSGVASEDMRLLIGNEATASAIKSAIGNWLARSVSASDTVYIFFSGHGLYEREFNEAYLLAYDSEPKDAYSTALSVSELTHALTRRLPTGRVLILADAVRRDFFDPDRDQEAASWFTRAFNRLASERDGLQAMIASGPGEFSREGQRWGGQGVFTKHLAEALSGMADRNGDGLIDSDEAFSFLSERVSQDTSGKQHPWRTETPVARILLPSLSRRDSIARAAAPEKTLKPPETGDVRKPEPAQSVPAGNVEPRKSAERAGKIERPDRPADAAAQPSKGQPSEGAEQIGREARPATAEPKPSTDPGTAAGPVSSERPAALNREQARKKAGSPPVTAGVSATQKVNPSDVRMGNKEVAVAAPPPPRPTNAPPALSTVTAGAARSDVEPAVTPVPATASATAPSPLVLQIEAAISSGSLIEPKNASAWDYYQRLSQQGGSADAARLKAALVEALAKSGRAIVAGDVRGDNISEKVDEFKKAGQMLARARALAPESGDVVALEKLSAAQALIALQFYDEAERALGQIEGAKSAPVENALGLIYQGKLDSFRAERAFKRAIELDGKWAPPHYNLALIYKGQQNESTLEEFERAAALDPHNLVMITALGDEYFSRQQWQRAADAFRKAISLAPADENLHTKLGHALYSQGQRDQANEEYQKAKELRNRKP